MKQEPLIAPSILSADFARLGEEVAAVLAAGADIVHFDVMDNHFVPNLTIGPMVCGTGLRHPGAHRRAYLVSPVDRLIGEFADAGADYITFHPEASAHIDRSLQLIKERGLKAGLVFNPATPLSYLEHVMEKIDMVLLMSVNPGFGGQAFIPSALPKLRAARELIERERPAHPTRNRRWGQSRQHRRHRRRRRRHLRGRFSHLRQGRLPRENRRPARRHRRRRMSEHAGLALFNLDGLLNRRDIADTVDIALGAWPRHS